MGFLVSLTKSNLTPRTCFPLLSTDIQHWVLSKVCHTLVALNILGHVWYSLLGSFNSAASVHLSDRILHHHLTFKGNSRFPIWDQNRLTSFPAFPCPLLQWWLERALLASPVPWAQSPPIIFAKTDTSDIGRGLQALLSQQAKC